MKQIDLIFSRNRITNLFYIDKDDFILILFNFLKKHVCSDCGKKFYKVENFMHHQLLYHSNNGSYDCSNCGLTFSDMDKLKDHVRRDHSYKRNSR